MKGMLEAVIMVPLVGEACGIGGASFRGIEGATDPRPIPNPTREGERRLGRERWRPGLCICDRKQGCGLGWDGITGSGVRGPFGARQGLRSRSEGA